MANERRRLEPWPLLLAGALAAMIAISIAFLFVSIEHRDPLLVSDAYAAEPDIADALRARARADANGWRLAVVTRPDAGGVAVEAVLEDARGTPLVAARVLVARERPAEGGLDEEIELDRADAGFTGHVPLPRAGRWNLVVRAERDGARAERRIAIRGPG